MEKKVNFTLEDFFYDLPEELVAQFPVQQRDNSRLFVIDRKSDTFLHSYFKNITDFLQEGDLLVFNNVRVINARIYCKRQSGGKLEIVLTDKIDDYHWKIISNRTKRLAGGEIIHPLKNDSLFFKIMDKEEEFLFIESNVSLTEELLKEIGEVPLPPYIHRENVEVDFERYQTVYASVPGAVAAPTAGLHFTPEILDNISKKGCEIAFITLFVSWGTFSPVRDNDLSKHKMHSEKFFLSDEVASRINFARKSGRRIIAVGTTTLRVLESTFFDGKNKPGNGQTDIFIYPPYKVKSVNGLITNLHTPYSTLLMLVASFAGYDRIMRAYKEAVKERYRFFSYGDAMLIL